MEQEKHDTNELDWQSEIDDEEDEIDIPDDEHTFGFTDATKKRCEKCKRRSLKAYVLDGFNVLYCEGLCHKPVCPICRHPALEPYNRRNGVHGLRCTKCKAFNVETLGH